MTPEEREKRARLMRRSMALGHCVCEARKPCPCDVFKRLDVCECAGERRPAPPGPVKLTQIVRKAGCSSKVSKRDLEAALAGLPELNDSRVVVGRSAGDDAGVMRLDRAGGEADGEGDGLTALTVLTVDVFAPSVDDPYTFGLIAAANSVSDVYAMGAVPEVALSIIGFPVDSLPVDVMRDILRGGIDKMREAGVPVVGGHSINDEEVKFGFAVVGRARGEGLVTVKGARAGDAVVLTKPLGVGVVTFANQVGRADERSVRAVTESMATLNRLASERMLAHGAHAATDVTGFGLLGHMAEVVRQGGENGGIEVELDFDRVALFEGAAELARREVLPGAVERNRESVDEAMLDLSALTPAQAAMLFCPETSGGLLVFLPEEEAEAYVMELREGGALAAAVIGKVTAERPGGFVKVVTARADEFGPLELGPAGREADGGAAPAAAAVATVGAEETSGEAAPSCCADAAPASPEAGSAASCCADGGGDGAKAASDAASPAAGPQGLVPLPSAGDAFKAYMRAVQSPGALDARQKKLISLALSVLSKCRPCVKIHMRAAREAGASDEEIAEAAAIAISFGGAPTAMFYSQLTGRR